MWERNGIIKMIGMKMSTFLAILGLFSCAGHPLVFEDFATSL